MPILVRPNPTTRTSGTTAAEKRRGCERTLSIARRALAPNRPTSRGDQPGRGPDDPRAQQPRADAEEDQDEERPLARLVGGLLRQQHGDRARPRDRDQRRAAPAEMPEPPPPGRRLAEGAGRAEQREPQRREQRGERRRHHGHAEADRQGDPAEAEARLGAGAARATTMPACHQRAPRPPSDEAGEGRGDRRGEGLDGDRAADLAGPGADGADHAPSSRCCCATAVPMVEATTNIDM